MVASAQKSSPSPKRYRALRLAALAAAGAVIVGISYYPGVAGQGAAPPQQPEDVGVTPHKALYAIDLVSTRSGSQIVDIKGKMFFEWKPSCDAWITDHRFNMSYEYADSPPMQIVSDYSTFESFDGKSFNFSSQRKRDGELYEELRGGAEKDDKGGKAVFTMPEDLSFDLTAGTLFPMAHTLELVRHIKAGDKFFSATIFDGSDNEGPAELNSFIGPPIKDEDRIKPGKGIDMSLLDGPARKVRMAFFPLGATEEFADYEMDAVFHENGVISDMTIEYNDFAVSQKLIAIEKVEPEDCGGKGRGQEQGPGGAPAGKRKP